MDARWQLCTSFMKHFLSPTGVCPKHWLFRLGDIGIYKHTSLRNIVRNNHLKNCQKESSIIRHVVAGVTSYSSVRLRIGRTIAGAGKTSAFFFKIFSRKDAVSIGACFEHWKDGDLCIKGVIAALWKM